MGYTKSAEYNEVMHDRLIREEWKERGQLTSIVSRKMNAMTVSGRVILPFRKDKTRSVTDPPEHSCYCVHVDVSISQHVVMLYIMLENDVFVIVNVTIRFLYTSMFDCCVFWCHRFGH